MDRKTLDELRTREICYMEDADGPVCGMTEAERDALFAYIDQLERAYTDLWNRGATPEQIAAWAAAKERLGPLLHRF